MSRRAARVPPLAMAIALAAAFFAILSLRHEAFCSWRVVSNLANGSAVLAIVSLGAALVILSGSIDLSVGAVVALASVGVATAIDELGAGAPLAFALVLAGGTAFGLAQGAIVHYLAVPPFLVTLAGMFLARGLALALAGESVVIADDLHRAWTALAIEPLPGLRLTPPAWIAFATAVVLAWTMRATRTGRDLLAVGGDAEVALAFGVPVARTRLFVHALAGGLSALGGIALTLHSGSGNSTAGVGLELEAIAAAVVGGVSLRGGRGVAEGALVGTAIFALIQEALYFEGSLAFGWARVAIGCLLLAFLGVQRLLERASRGF